ncbi:hypothetical protein GCM10022221_10200 [Actinocorallia aurea]
MHHLVVPAAGTGETSPLHPAATPSPAGANRPSERSAESPRDVLATHVLLRSFPEVLTLWWGESTRVWRALVHVAGHDEWVTGANLEHLGHALWTRLRTTSKTAPPAMPNHQHTAPRQPTSAPHTLQAPPPPRHPPVTPPSPLVMTDYRPGLNRRHSNTTSGPGILTRISARLRLRRSAA